MTGRPPGGEYTLGMESLIAEGPLRAYRLDVERAGSLPFEFVLAVASSPAAAAALAIERVRRRYPTQSLRVMGCWAFPEGEFAAMGAGMLELLAGGPMDVVDTGWSEAPGNEDVR